LTAAGLPPDIDSAIANIQDDYECEAINLSKLF
jgi:hypothetical protein